jgi:hypothetical protein
MSSSLWAFNETDQQEQARAQLHDDELQQLRQRGFRIFSWDELTEQAHGWLSDPDGYLWRLTAGEPLEGHQPGTSAVGLGRGWVVRPEGSDPRTLTELDKLVKVEQAQQAESRRKQVAQREAIRKTAPPVTAGVLLGVGALTLAEAARKVEAAPGRLEVRGGRLVVHLPPTAGRSARNAAALLYTGEQHVVEALKAKRPIPDREITGAGALVVSP